MASGGERFRQLRRVEQPQDSSARSHLPGRQYRETGDLFEHFGVPVGPVPPSVDVPVIAVGSCRQCGWFVPTSDPGPCPVCAEPSPL